MTKRELIDEISHLNATAVPAFLADFDVPDLDMYLQRLKRIQTPPLPAATAPRKSRSPRPKAKKIRAKVTGTPPPDPSSSTTQTEPQAALF